MTQTALNNAVAAMSAGMAEIGQKACYLRQAGDRYANELEHRLMILSLCKDSLQNYDVSCDLLTEEEIGQILENATGILDTINL